MLIYLNEGVRVFYKIAFAILMILRVILFSNPKVPILALETAE